MSQKNALPEYQTVSADLRRILMLADIAAEYGNSRRAFEHLQAAVEELGPAVRRGARRR